MYRILSANVLCWGEGEHSIETRIPLVIEMIKEAKPSSFGVQEAHIRWMKALERTANSRPSFISRINSPPRT